jgi:hypothetical protein
MVEDKVWRVRRGFFTNNGGKMRAIYQSERKFLIEKFLSFAQIAFSTELPLKFKTKRSSLPRQLHFL